MGWLVDEDFGMFDVEDVVGDEFGIGVMDVYGVVFGVGFVFIGFRVVCGVGGVDVVEG